MRTSMPSASFDPSTFCDWQITGLHEGSWMINFIVYQCIKAKLAWGSKKGSYGSSISVRRCVYFARLSDKDLWEDDSFLGSWFGARCTNGTLKDARFPRTNGQEISCGITGKTKETQAHANSSVYLAHTHTLMVASVKSQKHYCTPQSLEFIFIPSDFCYSLDSAW